LRLPNFGEVEKDVSISLKNIAFAERDLGHKMKGEFPREVPIPDLTRPNFGDNDDDVKLTK